MRNETYDDLAENKRSSGGRKVSRQAIYRRDDFTCIYCGASPTKDSSVTLHLDHVTPVVYGGSNTAGNVVTACASCNLSKSASIEESLVILPVVRQRNLESGIDESRPVEGVREKNDPRKLVSMRLSAEDEAYCAQHGDNVGAFVRSLIDYHRKETKRREAEKERLEIVISQEKKKADEILRQRMKEQKERLSQKSTNLQIEKDRLSGEIKRKEDMLAAACLGKTYLPPTMKVIAQRRTAAWKAAKRNVGDFDYEEAVRDLLEE